MTRTRHKTRYPGVSYRLVDETKPDGDRRYIVGFPDANGDWHTETLLLGSTLADALNRRAVMLSRKAKGETLLRTKMTVSELLDQWLESRRDSLKPTTVEAYEWAIESHLKKKLGRRKLVDLSPSDVAKMRADLTKELKTWSIKKIETPLKSALQVAVREGWISTSPYSKLLSHERLKADQREMRTLSTQEIQVLLTSTTSPRWRTLFSTLLFTGLRISEALALSWQDVNLEDSLIYVRQGKTTAAKRDVMMIPSLRALLRAHKLQQAPGVQLVFGRPSGASQSRRECLRALRVAEKKAGLPNYTLHELRHTFASILIAQGELPTFVASQMGHADPGVTMKTYAHLFEKEESITRASERLQAAFGGMV